MKRLGRTKRTCRGFEIVNFKDLNGDEYSLQQGSSAEESRICLGCNHETRHAVTERLIGARMHLNRKQVQALVNHLQAWLKNDTFMVSDKNGRWVFRKALDALALALAKHNHKWTKSERSLYELAMGKD